MSTKFVKQNIEINILYKMPLTISDSTANVAGANLTFFQINSQKKLNSSSNINN